MKLLLVAATAPEIQPLLSAFKINSESETTNIGKHSANVLITGAGMVPTAYAMGKHLTMQTYDLAINIGIAGSFDFNLELGEVCLVKTDTFAELGAEDGDEFISFDHLGLGISSQVSHPHPGLATGGLREVNAITVNKVHGNEFSIAKAIARFSPQIESMEGAAFLYACEQCGIPGIQIRAISNYVERRNHEKWNIGLAVKNLNETIIDLLEK
ncbi:MAG: futalosine hydrolase [Daejeonella sp.]|uniref:futalosine hydrolase n=1 Tax=Daejeonella sp. JGW-45 TaxID=3034148 RepID=UPI0023EC08BB|nr:futalosine hydrolase [Daejeonella sp. JGW-45]